MATPRDAAALLIDEDPLTSAANQAGLERRGYTVRLVGDSDAALALIEATHPGVVFVGTIKGKGKTSAEFLQGLRTSRSSQHTPVVILSRQPAGGAPRGQLQAVRREGW